MSPTRWEIARQPAALADCQSHQDTPVAPYAREIDLNRSIEPIEGCEYSWPSGKIRRR